MTDYLNKNLKNVQSTCLRRAAINLETFLVPLTVTMGLGNI